MTDTPTFLSTDRPDSRTAIHWFSCLSEDEPGETFEMGICVEQGEEEITIRLVDCDCNPDADHELRFARLKDELTTQVDSRAQQG